MRHIVLHHHIFKNAGSTLDHALQRYFREKFVDFDRADVPRSVGKDDLRAFLRWSQTTRCVTSHQFHTRTFPAPGNPEIDPEFVFFHAVVFRHPLDRIVSMYDFMHSGGGTPSIEGDLARETDLRGWVERMLDDCPHLINDVQVNLLANHGRYLRPPSERDLAISIARLDTFWLLGTTERYADTCIAAEYFARPTFPHIDLACMPQNRSVLRTGGDNPRIPHLREIFGNELFETLVRFNRLDLALYATAQRELDRRLDLVPDLAIRREAFELAEKETKTRA